MKLEVLVVTMNQIDFSKFIEMNLKCDAILANQSDLNDYQEKIISGNKVKLVTTNTQGVGINRNIALLNSSADILIFADDDMKYSEDYVENVIKAFEQLPQADVIIFSCNLTKNNEIFKKIENKIERKRFYNCLKYGTYTFAVRKNSLLKNNIFFNELFGGGAKYSSGEDSIFLRECFSKKLKVYSHNYIIGSCAKDTSTWFSGYNNKYFYDKGAWIACAFSKFRYLFVIYFLIRLKNRSTLTMREQFYLMLNGMNNFKSLIDYETFKEQVD